jgi:8-oxo-dGTP pyrophosphatase MutT (NUDIX family)
VLPFVRGDGDGWVECAQGHRHWGVHGAAGLLLGTGVESVATGTAAAGRVLLQHRAAWTHHGDTWGVLGGARQGSESPEQAAVREAAEEGGLDASTVVVTGEYVDDHGGWSYTTVLATAGSTLPAQPTGQESADVAWVGLGEVEDRVLHPGFASTWPLLRAELAPVVVVVDAANVVGSRPDGWWRDRAAAATRLLARLAAWAEAGVDGAVLPVGSALHRVWPRVEVVLEGAARSAPEPAPSRRVAVVRAGGSGDDAVVERAAAARRARTVVVTADRGLVERVRVEDAHVVGPRWLLEQLPPD